ncbi:carbohydrate-binding protein [Flavobacterium sp. Fl-77]|uniref:Carbohydrate-binding protein n=1 Tax=Flavobacterium flavipigmentatum TaxID=2893884 RepID=A0AAJ2S9P3_9FLAO|nr:MULTISPECIES: carbohydrate-binding protein [unclassified Flavobacterium]MDX6183651.1 carbohydrate-binding protein [Flavobacterium sp. Fl-33]MDX6187203.1 carbohydrate-binding protein [Flavobacterium sp. Fl-77]UFH37987.1 carbohydrate-binding protein [Flavobacterium sp. F-70]
MKKNIIVLVLSKLLLLTFIFFGLSCHAQVIMFDDFNYSGNNDPQLSSFNKWQIVNGVSGPPEGAMYSRNNVAFVTDPDNSTNKLMTLKTTVNGQSKAVTHSRIESSYEYFEGTYASRVYLSDESFVSKDANIQTFFTIVSSSLAQDGSKYSEMDIIEYMAADKWGVSPDNRVGYTTSYHKYIANPWRPWKTYSTQQKSLAGWHTFIATCTDGVNIKYYMDNTLIATHSVTDNETQAGLPVYPRSTMQVAFANWIWNNVLGTSTSNRENTFMADWVLYYKNTELSLNQINTLVANYRAQGLKRRNLAGQTFYDTPQNGVATMYKDCNYGGSAVSLPAGNYTLGDLQAKGILDNDISSLKVQNGYEVVLYTNDNFSGSSAVITSDDTCLVDNSFNDTATSLRVRAITNSSSVLIEAESYAVMSGIQTEATTDTGGGLNVGYTDTSDWMSYSNINFLTSGSYLIEYRVASNVNGAVISSDLSAGSIQLGAVNIPNTGGWQNWQTVSQTVNVNAGTYNFGIYIQNSGVNLNWFRITKAGSALTAKSAPTEKIESLTVYPSPTQDTLFFSTEISGASVSIINSQGGQTLSEQKVNNNSLDVSGLKTGIYLILVEKNGIKTVRRFVKK